MANQKGALILPAIPEVLDDFFHKNIVEKQLMDELKGNIPFIDYLKSKKANIVAAQVVIIANGIYDVTCAKIKELEEQVKQKEKLESYQAKEEGIAIKPDIKKLMQQLELYNHFLRMSFNQLNETLANIHTYDLEFVHNTENIMVEIEIVLLRIQYFEELVTCFKTLECILFKYNMLNINFETKDHHYSNFMMIVQEASISCHVEQKKIEQLLDALEKESNEQTNICDFSGFKERIKNVAQLLSESSASSSNPSVIIPI